MLVLPSREVWTFEALDDKVDLVGRVVDLAVLRVSA